MTWNLKQIRDLIGVLDAGRLPVEKTNFILRNSDAPLLTDKVLECRRLPQEIVNLFRTHNHHGNIILGADNRPYLCFLKTDGWVPLIGSLWDGNIVSVPDQTWKKVVLLGITENKEPVTAITTKEKVIRIYRGPTFGKCRGTVWVDPEITLSSKQIFDDVGCLIQDNRVTVFSRAEKNDVTIFRNGKPFGGKIRESDINGYECRTIAINHNTALIYGRKGQERCTFISTADGTRRVNFLWGDDNGCKGKPAVFNSTKETLTRYNGRLHMILNSDSTPANVEPSAYTIAVSADTVELNKLDWRSLTRKKLIFDYFPGTDRWTGYHDAHMWSDRIAFSPSFRQEGTKLMAAYVVINNFIATVELHYRENDYTPIE